MTDTAGSEPHGVAETTRCAGSFRLLATSQDTEGRFAVVEAVEDQGSRHPLHVHSREDEMIYVLEGRLSIFLQGQWFIRGVGESLVLPNGHEHTYVITSKLARMLMIVIPAGLEQYYQRLSRPGDEPCIYQDAERLIVLASRFGIDITGPPPNLALTHGDGTHRPHLVPHPHSLGGDTET